jgi:hypothetical protein
MVVFVLTSTELLGELGRGPEDHTPVELVFIGPMTALDLAIDLGQPRGICRWTTPGSRRCQVKSVPNSEPWSVWMRWMAIGRRRRTSPTKSVADLMELWGETRSTRYRGVASSMAVNR